jgi:plasmid stabilization system protein ParE
VSTLPVVVRPHADQQIDEAFAWWAHHRSLDQASRWFSGILAAIEKIGENPTRYPKHAEADRFPFEVREMLYGLGRHKTHRVLFTIRPKCVYVLAVLHVAQDIVGLDDI